MPSSVRIGMFWRFGSCDEMRPVSATTWLKVVWMRPVRGEISGGSASRYVPLSLVTSRCSRIGVMIAWLELLERVRVGREAGLGAADALGVERQLLVEDLLELLGRADVELLAGERRRSGARARRRAYRPRPTAP